MAKIGDRCRKCGGKMCKDVCNAVVVLSNEEKCEAMNIFGYRCTFQKDHNPLSLHYFIGSPSLVRISDDTNNKIQPTADYGIIIKKLVDDMIYKDMDVNDNVVLTHIRNRFRHHTSKVKPVDRRRYDNSMSMITAYLDSQVVINS